MSREAEFEVASELAFRRVARRALRQALEPRSAGAAHRESSSALGSCPAGRSV